LKGFARKTPHAMRS